MEKNKSTITIAALIALVGFIVTFSVTMFTSGQALGEYRNKVDNVIASTVPTLEKAIAQMCVKQDGNHKEIMGELRAVADTLLNFKSESRYDRSDLRRRLDEIGNKINKHVKQ